MEPSFFETVSTICNFITSATLSLPAPWPSARASPSSAGYSVTTGWRRPRGMRISRAIRSGNPPSKSPSSAEESVRIGLVASCRSEKYSHPHVFYPTHSAYPSTRAQAGLEFQIVRTSIGNCSMNTSKPSLVDRFMTFVGRLEGSENIDDSLSNVELSFGKRADFLLNERQVILEIKSLEINPQYKIDQRLSPHRSRSEFPLFYWTSDLEAILPNLPDGEEIRRDIFHAVTRAVQTALEKADDQIQATKSALKLGSACGVVAMLNENVDILSPDVVTAKASQMLLKLRDGGIRYRQISFVWIISESHMLISKDGAEHLPLILLEGPTADDYANVGKYLDYLQLKWAEFEGHKSLSRTRLQNFEGVNFKKQSAERKDNRRASLARHEIWRRRYRAQPYLRSLSETDFLEHSARVLTTMMPHFLIGGKKLPHATVAQLMEGWTHILEEAEHRNLDMKKLQRKIPRFDSC